MAKHFSFVAKWGGLGILLACVYLAGRGTGLPNFDRFRTHASHTYSEAVNRAVPSVVSIRTATAVRSAANPLLSDPLFQEFFDAPNNAATKFETGLGSGVVVGPNVIATNHHVVNGVDRIEVVLFDGRRGSAIVLGVDPETDLAVIQTQIDLPPPIALAAPGATNIGDVALAIGNPLGIGLTVTQGIVSATGRDKIGINTFENFIQTDAAINPGNSGGALVNTDGQLIGINAAILGYQGIGFAIPTALAKNVIQQLLNTGEVTRGWLGIEARDLSPALRNRFGITTENGIIVLGVMPQGPAALAGLEAGDVIFEIDGTAIDGSRDALNQISNLEPAAETRLKIERRGKVQEVVAMVQSRPRVRP
ncbi:MAG: trypsin-like peptidase domain-containing protein [Pseudomonadota bacterium]